MGIFQDRLAGKIVWLSGLIIIGLVGVAAAVIFTGVADDRKETLQFVFTSIVPITGTWMGTVLAYYFSQANFESAAKNTRLNYESASNLNKIDGLAIKDVWIDFAAMDKFVRDDQATIEKIESFITDKKRGRVPVFKSQAQIDYVIHKSTLYEYLQTARVTQNGAERPAARTDSLALFEAAKMADGRTYGEFLRNAWIAAASGDTVAKIKAEMDRREDIQDAMVTDTGKRDGAVLGWITDAAIAAKLRAV